MFPYILITFILIFLSIIRLKNDVKRVVFVSISIFLCLFAGLRGMGYDYEPYAYYIYNNIDSPPMEPGFSILLWITQLFHNSIALLLTVAIIAVALKASFIYKYSYNYFLSLLIYFHISFLIHDMGQMRYGLAMGVVLWAMDALLKDKKKMFFVLVTLAVSFHYSALIVYPIYFLRNYRVSTKLFIILCLSSFALVTLNATGVFFWVADHIPIVGVVHRIDFYVTEGGDFESKGAGFNFSFLFRLFVLLLFYFVKKHNDNHVVNAFFNFYVYGIFVYLILTSVPSFSYRCSFYFKLLEIIIIPFIIYRVRNILLKPILLAFMISYCSYGVFFHSPDDVFWKDYEPYKTAL